MKRVVYFGHSAGGYLALWLCCLQTEIRLNLPFVPMLCVAVAPIGDLEAAFYRRLGDEGDVVEQFMGCDPECDGNNQYQWASPARLLPLNSHCLLISGQNDEDVPSDLVAQYYILCTTFAAKHKRNEDACTNVDNRDSFILEYHEIRNADHYMLVDAETSAWAELSQIYFKTFGKCQETPLSP